MADLELIEGFDHTDGTASDMSLLDDKSATGSGGWNGAGLTDTGVTPVTGRDGSGLAMRFATAETGASIDFQLAADIVDSNTNGILLGGFALRLNFEPSDMTGAQRASVMQCKSTAGDVEAGILVTRGGAVACHRDTQSTGLVNQGTGPSGAAKPIIRNGTWHYITFIFEVGENSTSEGGWQVWVDRQLAVDSVAEVVSWSTGNDLRTVSFNKNTSAGSMDIDDLWLAQVADKSDIVGRNPGPSHYSIRHGLVRDPQVRILFPDANGNQNDFTQVGTGTNNFEFVDENPDDGDTTALDSSAAADVELYGYPNVGTDVNKIPAMAVSFTEKETVATGFNVSARTRHSTNEATTGTAVATTNTTYEAKQARARRSVGSTPSNITVTLTNPGAESATDPPTGWTQSGDNLAGGAENSGPPVTARTGTWWFYFDGVAYANGEEGRLLQNVTMATDSVPLTDVDAGNLQVRFNGYCNLTSGFSDGVMYVRFLDVDGNTIEENRLSVGSPGANVWTSQFEILADIPPGTRSIDYEMGGVENVSPTVNIFWDDMAATIEYIDNLDEFTTTQADAAEMGVITA